MNCRTALMTGLVLVAAVSMLGTVYAGALFVNPPNPSLGGTVTITLAAGNDGYTTSYTKIVMTRPDGSVDTYNGASPPGLSGVQQTSFMYPGSFSVPVNAIDMYGVYTPFAEGPVYDAQGASVKDDTASSTFNVPFISAPEFAIGSIAIAAVGYAVVAIKRRA